MRKIRTAKAHVAAQQEHRNAKLSDRNARWRLLENKGRFSACDVSLTKPSLSSGNSKRSMMGRVIAVPQIRKSLLRHGSGTIKVEGVPAESVRLAWRSRSPRSEEHT